MEKMMSCKGPDRGYFVYQCPKCGEIMAGYAQIAVSGTRTNGQRRSAVRCSTCRIVMTFPDKLRPVLKEDRKLWKVVMDSAIKALNDTLSYAVKKEVLAGAIIVLHFYQ